MKIGYNGLKVKQMTLWNQASNWKMVWYSRKIIESSGYHQSQVGPCEFYIKYSVILNYVDGCVIVSYKQETIISLIK